MYQWYFQTIWLLGFQTIWLPNNLATISILLYSILWYFYTIDFQTIWLLCYQATILLYFYTSRLYADYQITRLPHFHTFILLYFCISILLYFYTYILLTFRLSGYQATILLYFYTSIPLIFYTSILPEWLSFYHYIMLINFNISRMTSYWHPPLPLEMLSHLKIECKNTGRTKIQ